MNFLFSVKVFFIFVGKLLIFYFASKNYFEELHALVRQTQ